ncbi:UDP-2,4-diacetamido-2,4,6-trideoxy-beta-L-altropyranose hydrolase [Pedobacter sp. CAN_A7]|uniref:UDP-2,4-diacetamido-2,4, 6-trideoxy-beta-L-altropyranose hydrolase n=1 Tax=Pedobacter sp. CAN_A7 TaxID=2787722 RepID=UPI0018C986A2
MKPAVYIRVDGSSSIGLGHLVRCIALAQMLKDIFNITFFCKQSPANISKEIVELGFGLLMIHEEAEFLTAVNASCIVVLDHYDLDSDYQKTIKATGAKLLCIDDLNDKDFYADVILNHAPHVDSGLYHAQIGAIYAFGLDYVLLRPVFLEAAKKSNLNRSTLDVFVCFGGADPRNITQEVVNVLIGDKRFRRINIVLGSAYRFLETLQPAVERDKRFHLHHSISETEMCDLMSVCGLAIVPASGVLQEALATGCKVISGLYVENQQLTHDNYLALGAFISAGSFKGSDIKRSLDLAMVQEQVENRLIDGKSGIRISKLFKQLLVEESLTLTRANKGDLLTTFNWANDQTIRAFSFSKANIPLVDHTKWYLNKIASKDCFYYIGVIDGKTVGSIRYDITETIALISYLIDPAYHNQGLGLFLLKHGILHLLKDSPIEISRVVGMVMKDNIASVKAFERLGYKKTPDNQGYKFFKDINYENRVI